MDVIYSGGLSGHRRIHGCVSAKARHMGIPIEHFAGSRLDCEVCDRPFRSFRSDETHCGSHRHLKASPAPLAS